MVDLSIEIVDLPMKNGVSAGISEIVPFFRSGNDLVGFLTGGMRLTVIGLLSGHQGWWMSSFFAAKVLLHYNHYPLVICYIAMENHHF